MVEQSVASMAASLVAKTAVRLADLTAGWSADLRDHSVCYWADWKAALKAVATAVAMVDCSAVQTVDVMVAARVARLAGMKAVAWAVHLAAGLVDQKVGLLVDSMVEQTVV